MAITEQAAFSSMPRPSTRGRPRRLISAPAKNAGAYMPIRCHCMMLAPSPMLCWHATAASGAAVMMNIIVTEPTTLLARAATKMGWRMTSPSARAGSGWSWTSAWAGASWSR